VRDFWFAECVPCHWQEKYFDQDSAIHAVEDHIADHHARTSSQERLKQGIGHVQNRTEIATATLQPDPIAQSLMENPTALPEASQAPEAQKPEVESGA
jgi:hypothetical protein